MKFSSSQLDYFERRSVIWMEKQGFTLLRLSIGVIFLWFGALKFFPGLSPAQDLAIKTIMHLTFGLVPATAIIWGLAFWEVLIGLCFVVGKFMKIGIILLLVQMLGTFAPIFFFPQEVFTKIPYGLTIEGQYIFKNFVIIAAAIVIGSKVFAKKAEVNS